MFGKTKKIYGQNSNMESFHHNFAIGHITLSPNTRKNEAKR